MRSWQNCGVTIENAERPGEGIDGSRQPDPGEDEAGATATTPEVQPAEETAAPVAEQHGDRSPESTERTTHPQETAVPSGTKWMKAATVATAAGTVMAAFAAVGALYFSNSTLSATNDQLGLARQTAQSELFKSASEQLDSDKESVRLSGVYLLERLAQGSVTDQPTVRRLLEAFVRTEATPRSCEGHRQEAPVDIQAALDVIKKYAVLPNPTPRVKLQGACLARAFLYNAQFTGANLVGVNLTKAVLTVSQLHEVDLAGAMLQSAHAIETVFSEAKLTGANLTGANLASADLTGADLTGATLEEANLSGADLSGATLVDTNLSGATLWNVNLSGADLLGANLDDAHFIDVVYDSRTRWPDGFTPP